MGPEQRLTQDTKYRNSLIESALAYICGTIRVIPAYFQCQTLIPSHILGPMRSRFLIQSTDPRFRLGRVQDRHEAAMCTRLISGQLLLTLITTRNYLCGWQICAESPPGMHLKILLRNGPRWCQIRSNSPSPR